MVGAEWWWWRCWQAGDEAALGGWYSTSGEDASASFDGAAYDVFPAHPLGGGFGMSPFIREYGKYGCHAIFGLVWCVVVCS